MMDNPELGLDNELEVICDTVQAKAIYTYLPKGTKLDGEEIKMRPLVPESYVYHGDSILIERLVNNQQKNRQLELFNEFASKILDPISSFKKQDSLIITTIDIESKKVLVVAGKQDGPKNSKRGGSVKYSLFVEMPSISIDQLINMFEREPTLFEKFYQRVFKDLDSKPNEDTGLRRIKVGRLLLFNMSEAIEEVGSNCYSMPKFACEQVLNMCKEKELPEKIGVRN